MTVPPATRELPRGRVVAWLAAGAGYVIGVCGVGLLLYASLLLPGVVDNAENAYGVPRRVLQFGFAAVVPVAGFAAAGAATASARHRTGLRPAAVRLAVAAVAFAGWTLTFLDWHAS